MDDVVVTLRKKALGAKATVDRDCWHKRASSAGSRSFVEYFTMVDMKFVLLYEWKKRWWFDTELSDSLVKYTCVPPWASMKNDAELFLLLPSATQWSRTDLASSVFFVVITSTTVVMFLSKADGFRILSSPCVSCASFLIGWPQEVVHGYAAIAILMQMLDATATVYDLTIILCTSPDTDTDTDRYRYIVEVREKLSVKISHLRYNLCTGSYEP